MDRTARAIWRPAPGRFTLPPMQWQKGGVVSEQKLAAFLQDKRAQPDVLPLPQITQREHFSIKLPRRVYLFWDKGFDAAPDIVKLCALSWQSLNPD